MIYFELFLFLFSCWLIGLTRIRENRETTTSLRSCTLHHHWFSDDYSLEGLMKRQVVNNTIFLMMTDYGYLDHFLNAYYAGNLSDYSNLIVTCLDSLSYQVIISLLSSNSDSIDCISLLFCLIHLKAVLGRVFIQLLLD